MFKNQPKKMQSCVNEPLFQQSLISCPWASGEGRNGCQQYMGVSQFWGHYNIRIIVFTDHIPLLAQKFPHKVRQGISKDPSILLQHIYGRWRGSGLSAETVQSDSGTSHWPCDANVRKVCPTHLCNPKPCLYPVP